MSIYDHKPDRFLEKLEFDQGNNPPGGTWCAGFERQAWRCSQFANHLIEWLPEYALPEEELQVNHGNLYVKLQQAAVRVYTSGKYKKRGEAGELALHAICRDFFDTVPISPRVFYISASNDVIKGFDLVHARFPEGKVEIWLGESKLYTDSGKAIADAISSVSNHIEAGFLRNQKLLLGPQIPKSTPHYDKILELFKAQSSLDKFLNAATFVIGIACSSPAAKIAKECDSTYRSSVNDELRYLQDRVNNSGLHGQVKILLIYVPLAEKEELVTQFDRRLKGLQS